MKKSDDLYIVQILDSTRKIKKYTKGISFGKFKNNEEKQSAVIMQLILIGEISKKVSSRYKSKVKIPWKQIAGFRDRAVHKYFSLDLEQLWKTIEDDITDLQKKLQKK